jgi:hypothetical protein
MPVNLEGVLAALSGSRISLVVAETRVPGRPGLYAVYGPPAVWKELGLGKPPDGRPLYVGKSECSLLARDIGTHFGDGRTGQSTVRRSMAALLREHLDLHGQPRNTEKPGYFSNYGLSPGDDAKLTAWMRKHLKLAIWAPEKPLQLRPVESQIIIRWQPPLNLTDVITEWTSEIKAARKLMADEARVWRSNLQT